MTFRAGQDVARIAWAWLVSPETRPGVAWLGGARRGEARHDCAGHGAAPLLEAKARRVRAWRGVAPLGEASLTWAWQGSPKSAAA